MGILDTALTVLTGRTPARASTTLPLTFQQWVDMFKFGANTYAIGSLQQTLPGVPVEQIDANFTGLVSGAFRANGPVFALELARVSLFSEARFAFRQVTAGGLPGEFMTGADGRTPFNRGLGLLSRPWPNGTTGDLLAKMLLHADFAGNAYVTRRPGNRLKVMRPDWVTMVMGSDVPGREVESADDLDATLIGFLYHPGGANSGITPVTLLADEVAHFAPMPDPLANYRGMPWLTPVIREIEGDAAATDHKVRFFENGATPNMVVSLDPAIPKEAFKEWVATFEGNHRGTVNAYRTLFLGAGAKVEVVGSDLKQLDFKLTQGAGESRLAAAAGVPPIIAGFSEGLQSATYSNYGQARRRFADLTMRPLWRNVSGSLQVIAPPPANAELWYVDRHIQFLAEDQKDAAEVAKAEASTIQTLVNNGWEPESVKAAILAGDWSRLVHTGLTSVQLQAPLSTEPAPPEAPPPDEEPAPDEEPND